MSRKPHVALMVETASAFGQQVLRGVNRYMQSHQPWSVFLEQRALTSKLPAWLKDWRGDGIISRSTNADLMEIVARSNIPLVDLTDRHGHMGLYSVWSDHAAIGKLAAEHLIERGFRQFAFCGFSHEDWSQQRRAGFLETIQRSGGHVDTYESAWHGSDAHPWEHEQRELTKWLGSLPKPTGIMACNDVRGQHVLDACSRIDLAVPEEAAVIGVDNDELLCALCDPPLTSVVPNPERVGYDAAEALDQMMHGKDLPPSVHFVEPLGVETRQSTDVFAIADPDIAAAMRFIREHACEGISVGDVLRHVPLSRSALERRFRKYLNRSPQMEIRSVQLKRVKQLLTETDLPLERIATLAGYEHPEYMNVVFKRELGQPPGAFRRQARK
jgi:LacI family transcriptional regulator